jgi:hypothetical protein
LFEESRRKERNDMTTSSQSYTATIEVAKSPHHVFECIRDVSKWNMVIGQYLFKFITEGTPHFS